jgi:hypothetical protein
MQLPITISGEKTIVKVEDVIGIPGILGMPVNASPIRRRCLKFGGKFEA